MYICYDTQGKFLYRPPICRISDACVLGFRCLADGSHVQCKRKLSILCIKDTMRKMICGVIPYIYPHQRFCIFFGLWSGIVGIVALALNDWENCDESHQTLMVLGIGLLAFSVLYFLHCSQSYPEALFLPLVNSSAIFVFVLACVLISHIVTGYDTCYGDRGRLRLFIVVSTVPFQLVVLYINVAIFRNMFVREDFYGRVSAQFQTVML